MEVAERVVHQSLKRRIPLQLHCAHHAGQSATAKKCQKELHVSVEAFLAQGIPGKTRVIQWCAYLVPKSLIC